MAKIHENVTIVKQEYFCQICTVHSDGSQEITGRTLGSGVNVVIFVRILKYDYIQHIH